MLQSITNYCVYEFAAFINQASILIEDTMVIRVEVSRNLLSRDDLQCVACCVLADELLYS